MIIELDENGVTLDGRFRIVPVEVRTQQTELDAAMRRIDEHRSRRALRLMVDMENNERRRAQED